MAADTTTTPGPPAAAPPAPAADPKKPAGASAAPAPAKNGAPPAAVGAAQDKLEAAGGEVPEQKRGETDQDYEVRLARMTRELKSARQEAQRNKVDKQQLETMKAELEKAKNKRISKAEFVQLVKDLDAGKAQLDDDEWAALPQAVRDRITALEQAEAERAKERQERDNTAQRSKEEGIVANALKEMAADLPLFEGRDNIHSDVLDIWYERFMATGQKPDLEQVAREVHASLASTVFKALQSESTRRFLLGQHPELKALLGHEAKAGGPTSEAKGSGGANGRAAEPASSTDSKPPRALTRFEQEQEATRRLRARAEEVAAEIRARKAEEAASKR